MKEVDPWEVYLPDSLRGHLTVPLNVAAKALGWDYLAAWRRAEQGEIPVIRFGGKEGLDGRRRRPTIMVPVPLLIAELKRRTEGAFPS